MLDQTTRILSENLARAMTRRTFLTRAGQAVFGVVATVAPGHSLVERAEARRDPGVDPLAVVCTPPGPYCNTGGGPLSGCHGAHCFQNLSGGQVRQCHVFYQFFPTGCWTNVVAGGYWTCCDCQCDGGSNCGCAQYSGSPVPLPDKPGSARG
jgi:hypothetical protein